MLSEKNRTVERYLEAGAMIRFLKSVFTNTVTVMAPLMTSKDLEYMLKAHDRLEEISMRTENRMFNDHPRLSTDYYNVFYGDKTTEPRSDVDKEVLRLMLKYATRTCGEINTGEDVDNNGLQ